MDIKIYTDAAGNQYVNHADYLKIKEEERAEQRAKDHQKFMDNITSSVLSPKDSLKLGSQSLATGIMEAFDDPDDPTSVFKGAKMVLCIFGIIATIIVQALAAYLVAFNSSFVEAHYNVVKVIFSIIEIGGLLLVICLIRAMFDRPLLIKMLFDRELYKESQRYHSSTVKGTKSIVFLILLGLIAIIGIAFAIVLFI